VELEKRRLGVGGHALVSGGPEHWTIRAKLHRMITMHARPRHTGGQTHGRTLC